MATEVRENDRRTRLWIVVSGGDQLTGFHHFRIQFFEGPYAYVRHPQYDGFILIMLGFLLQWPSLITLIMFPVLVFMYVRLAQQEEREVLAEFDEKYKRYMLSTPAFFPRLTVPRRRQEA